VTPGIYDYRASLPAFGFPESMQGMTVLDVGSATGFFCFEFERRGARVTSVELPSLHHLDCFPGQSLTQTLRQLAKMRVAEEHLVSDPLVALTAGETYFYHLDGPFQFCHRLLQSQAERIYSTVYRLQEALGSGKTYDFVFLGDVLLHTINPFQALASVARHCHGQLMIAQQMPEEDAETPAIRYVGGDSLDQDDLCWFLPNEAFFHQVLRKLGFQRVERIGRNQGGLRPTGFPYDRPILRASR
jgi:SAM-dependent methyltransferase